MVNLPPTLSDESITSLCLSLQLPPPESITPLSVAAEYHSIYLLSFPASCASSITSSNKSLKLGLEPDGSVILVLRASARHLPGGYKTRNEVGIMRWIRKNTSIPIPEVIRFDDGENNPIGHEFTLLEKAPGKSVDSIYDDLSDLQKRELVKQLAGYIIELHSPSLRWKSPCVGGLVLDDEDEKVRPGPPIEETFWDQADIDKLWPVGETIESLNPLSQGAFSGYREYIAGSMERYIYAINKHETLAGYRDMVPRLEGFVRGIRASENAELDDIAYVVAHKDLHFANIMCELGENGDDIVITSVLDWEFSGIVPACRWNPVRAFLYALIALFP